MTILVFLSHVLLCLVMHQVFQRDLLQLRLQAAQCYSESLKSSLIPVTTTRHTTSLNVSAQGRDNVNMYMELTKLNNNDFVHDNLIMLSQLRGSFRGSNGTRSPLDLMLLHPLQNTIDLPSPSFYYFLLPVVRISKQSPAHVYLFV